MQHLIPRLVYNKDQFVFIFFFCARKVKFDKLREFSGITRTDAGNF